ncbi:hypothetical protein EZV62_023462 [Acer yangbiense]|uniref:Uncharacterized protein n=1 Tax=Acer yangbiense TaxID=1000413 RepID=A0A5C7H1T1_9ROSI|nr:hypothetical protein EZV62_023462 [Acer yangbiense]
MRTEQVNSKKTGIELKSAKTKTTTSDPYERAKAGRLTFKGGSLATRKSSIDKKKKKYKKNKKKDDNESDHPIIVAGDEAENGAAGQVYTIDAAKNMNYDELFPVEAKKFGYEPKSAAAAAKTKTIEEALDDRVKKKAGRYCK